LRKRPCLASGIQNQWTEKQRRPYEQQEKEKLMNRQDRKLGAGLFAVACFSLALWPAVFRNGVFAAPPDRTITGTVTDVAGKPLRGAPVTARLDNMSVSRYTDASGKYQIAGLKPGSYEISATAYGYESKTMEKKISTSAVEVAFSLKPEWNPMQISAAEYISAFGDDKDMRNIEANCESCHNLSWIMRRRGMTAEEWKRFIPKMGTRFYLPNLSEDKLTDISLSLGKVFGPDSPVPTQEQVHHVAVSDEALHATFRYFTAPTRNLTHSLSIAPDGKVWFTEFDYIANRVGSFDPASQQFQEYESPTPKSTPHNPWVARNGMVWFSERQGRKLSVIDPETGKITEYPVPDKAGIHTLREDSQGNIWTSGYIARFDPHAQKFTVFGTPYTYDMALDARDYGWGAAGPDKPGLFSVNPKTGDIKLYPVADMDFVRGMEVDAQQNIWFGDVTNHRLGKFDPKTEKITYYKPPTSNFGPYGIVIDKRTGNLWVADFLGASVDRFDPATGKFTEYPFPDRKLMDRFFAMDSQGRVWFTDFNNGRIGVLETDDMKISARR
jgi:virginiamycin B lyase